MDEQRRTNSRDHLAAILQVLPSSLPLTQHTIFFSDASTVARFTVPARQGPGNYVVFFYGGGYKDCADINVLPASNGPVLNRYGQPSGPRIRLPARLGLIDCASHRWSLLLASTASHGAPQVARRWTKRRSSAAEGISSFWLSSTSAPLRLEHGSVCVQTPYHAADEPPSDADHTSRCLSHTHASHAAAFERDP
jgi:hypothetical protein